MRKANSLAREITLELIRAGHVRDHEFTAVSRMIQAKLDEAFADLELEEARTRHGEGREL